MTHPLELEIWLESVQSVWVLWIVSMFASLALARMALRFRPWRTMAQFSRDERGSSYALPYVMSVPFLLIIVCTALQGTLIIVAKIGTVNAAYAASRAAIVWQGACPDSARDSRQVAEFYADRAAVVGMIPFAAGIKMRQVSAMLRTSLPTRGGVNVLLKQSIYERVYRRLAGMHPSGATSPIIRDPDAQTPSNYLRQKILVAAMLTDAEIVNRADVATFNQDVEVRVNYRMPLQVPFGAAAFNSDGLGAFFSSTRYYSRTIRTTVKLPSEAANTSTGRLEVPYYPEEI